MQGFWRHRVNGWIALLALAAQLILSFGRTDMIYGSGLRSDDFNLDHVPSYIQVNMGMSHEFNWGHEKPATIRFDIINLFDTVYEIRDGSGIGVFAPQFGPRREFLVGLSQKF